MLSVKPWRAETVMLLLVAQVICILLGGVTIGLLQKAGVHGFKDIDDLGYVLIGTLCFQGATWILMGVFFKLHGVPLSEGLGINRKLPLALVLALGMIIVVLPLAYWLQGCSITLMEKMHWVPKDEEAVDLWLNAASRATQIYLIVFTVILAPVAEEFIFRGVLYPFLKQRGFLRTAWIGASLFFAFIHGNAAAFVPLFVLSLALTWLYETTDCLLAPMFAHALFNAAGLLLSPHK